MRAIKELFDRNLTTVTLDQYKMKTGKIILLWYFCKKLQLPKFDDFEIVIFILIMCPKHRFFELRVFVDKKYCR